MHYFTQKFVDFFSELEKNNHKEWFDEHRKTYETEVKRPFYKLVTELIVAISQFDNSVEKDPKKAIFRINRDIRFSKDKSPYKTSVSAAFVKGGRKATYPGYYLGIGASTIHIGGGMYNLDKESLLTIRTHIKNNPEEFLEIIQNKKFKSTFGEVKGEKNKKLPAEFSEIQEKVPLIANKQFYFMTEIKDKNLILSEDFAEQIIEIVKVGYLLNSFLAEASE